ncbi:glucosaminidase domain-containing protein [Pseudoalteromonas denitrificans]|uniref:Bax protein n=1 Tax=Pseudoalteromonas denitrificans DSM 6059 TaxID=1123010 RepID=A0A1I1P2D7_9GAMM|nr:glucosaminidase domain-containing protein [Pseudoalteromonas denitrificans]SFD01123.1 Bax protein [Pseudoalteromonas denitrificans DSM 6059]
MFKSVLRLCVITFTLYGIVYPFLINPPKKTEQVAEEDIVINKTVKVIEEKPLHTVKLPDFLAIKDIKLKKKTFFNFIKPHVKAVNKQILQQRAQLEIALMMLQFDDNLADKQLNQVIAIFKQYKVKHKVDVEGISLALERVDIVPRELALMQAANESAWGTSRFAKIGLNFFGQWCYRKGCGMVPKNRNSGAGHEVAAYQTVRAAVNAYFYNINTNRAYRSLRKIRAHQRKIQQTPTAEGLAQGLLAYSERGEAYVNEISHMIRLNQEYFSE